MNPRGLWLAAIATFGITFAFACGDDSSTSPSTTTPDAGDVETSTEIDSSIERTTLGGPCKMNGDCNDGLECLHGDGKLDQWPAHGICSLKCDATDSANPAGESTCEAHTPGSHCARVGSSQGYCVEGCKIGGAAIGSLAIGPSPTKCHGRADLACKSLLGGTYGCYPTCNSDDACEGNGKCSVFGFCTSGNAKGWDQIGETDEFCEGNFSTGGSDPFCTAVCTVGVVPSCGWTGPGTKANAACVRGPSGIGPGDSATCARLCDCESDCDAPYKCSPLTATFAQETGRKGVCALSPSTNITCGDGGADGGDGGDGG